MSLTTSFFLHFQPSILFRCIPFYYTGCGGNENNFNSQEECEEVCPTTFSPNLQLPEGDEILVMRGQSEAQLPVSIKSNPASSVKWTHQGRQISSYDTQVTEREENGNCKTNPKL